MTRGGSEPKLLLDAAPLGQQHLRAPDFSRMTFLGKAMRWVVGACLSLVLLYCGVGMIMGIVMGRNLPPFPFGWVNWLNRPNIPPLADHVINFLLTSIVATLFKDMWRRKDAAAARGQQHI